MYHQLLQRQINKYLDQSSLENQDLQLLLRAIDESYKNNDRDKQLGEHLFQINEDEYKKLNQKLTQLFESLEQQVKDRTAEIEDIAQFPLENPNPIFRTNLEGNILFINPVGQQIQDVVFEGKKQKLTTFFKKFIPNIEENGSVDLTCDEKDYIFYFKKIETKKYVNLYAADVTEKRKIRRKAEENFGRLMNFLESTEDAYFIVYNTHSEKNLISSKWKNYFGFDPLNEKDIFAKKSNRVVSEDPKIHLKKLKMMKPGDRLSIRYQIVNPETGEKFWLSESLYKQKDLSLNDDYISGRITNITREHLYAMQMQETESRFQTIMDAAPVMVWVSDKNNSVSYTNMEMKKFLGYEMEKFKDNKKFIPKVHPDDRKKAIDEWGEQIGKRKSASTSFRLKDVNGKYHNITEKAIPRYYPDGSFAGYIGAYFDLTKETEYQESLSREKEKLEMITRNSPDIVLLTDEKGIIEYVSPNVKRTLGFSHTYLTGKSLDLFLCKECKEGLEKMNWLAMMAEGDRTFEYRMRCKNGKLIWVESSIRKIDQHDGKHHKLLMHNRDITRIKMAEAVLVENEKKYRGLFESMTLSVIEMDTNQKIQWVNRSFEKMSGYSLNYLKDKNAGALFLKDEQTRRKMKKKIMLSLQGQEAIHDLEIQNKKKDTLQTIFSTTPVYDTKGKVKSLVSILWDVTEMRRLEQAIIEEKAGRQKDIMKASIVAEELQRELLGRELHDGVGHQLAYTSLFLQMAKEQKNIDASFMGKVRDQVELALQEVKRISVSLVPLALSDLGLKEAIIELVRTNIASRNIRFIFNCREETMDNIEWDVQRNIFRIIQELVFNTIKHAKATEIKLSLKKTKTHLIIQYSNNGQYFDVKKAKQGVGLNSIVNRANFYDGTTSFLSEKRVGSTFNIEMPLKKIMNHE
jgi:PAS domain S-box-containing protein